jgi:hypothetical protein
LPIRYEQGYLIPAINTADVDYVACAVQLAKSIRQWHPDANISVLTVKQFSDPVFDHVIPLPYGDLGGYANDWQVFYASPYRQTIKLEADMIAASPVDHWWSLFEHRDVVVSTGCRNIYDQPGKSRRYRQIFDHNNLPDIYNAITYWRVSKTAQEFFSLIKTIFEQWYNYKKFLRLPDEIPSTDLVYAIAAQIMGVENVTLPATLGPNIVHMKKEIVPTVTQDWSTELIYENTHPGLRLQTVAQSGFVHYHVKDWKIL